MMIVRKLRRHIFMCVCVLLCGYIGAMLTLVNNIKMQLNSMLGKLDTLKIKYTGEPYIVIPNLITPGLDNTVSGESDIAICTHTSLNNLHHVINLSKMWDGHISVAVFSFDDEISQALIYISLMQMCSKDTRLRTSFHLVYPTLWPPINVKPIHNNDLNCDSLPLIRERHSRDNWANFALYNISYPVNILRNVAFMHSHSAYVLNLDIDLVPSKGMKKDLEAFLMMNTNKDRKIAYVIPSFESSIAISSSLSKNELKDAVKNGLMRQYSVKTCSKCHQATNYSRWMSLPYPSEMNSSYNVGFKMPYEPYYVAKRLYLPMFYEKFNQWGRDRVSQACEAYYSGFDFKAMNNAFVIHAGLKNGIAKYKRDQLRKNLHIYGTSFLNGLRDRYPQSNRTCECNRFSWYPQHWGSTRYNYCAFVYDNMYWTGYDTTHVFYSQMFVNKLT